MKGKLQLMLQRHIETTKNNNMPKITLGNQEEMGKFWESYKFPRLNQDEREKSIHW